MRKSLVLSVGVPVLLLLSACGGQPAATSSVSPPDTTATAPGPMETPAEVLMPADLIPAGLDTSGSGQRWGFISSEGAVGVFRLPSEQSDYCKKANDYLKRSYTANKLGAYSAYKCVTVAVDNRNGSGTVNMYGMQLLDAEGKAYDSVDLSDDQGWMWYDRTGKTTSSDSTLYNEGVDLSNNGNKFYLNPGAKGEKTLFFKEFPANPTFVYVMPSGGFEQTSATKVG